MDTGAREERLRHACSAFAARAWDPRALTGESVTLKSSLAKAAGRAKLVQLCSAGSNGPTGAMVWFGRPVALSCSSRRMTSADTEYCSSLDVSKSTGLETE